MTCPACGAAFPEPVKKAMVLRNDDIMGLEGKELEVTAWAWREHTSKASGIKMLACTLYGGLSDKPITEYWPILHEGYAGQKARSGLAQVAQNSGSKLDYSVADLSDIVSCMNSGVAPRFIEYKLDGKFYRVLSRKW
jgi:hypothetical protein